MEIALDQFVRDATDNGLVSADEIAAARETLPPKKRDSGTTALAKVLIQAGKLTKYQAAAIYQGNCVIKAVGPVEDRGRENAIIKIMPNTGKRK
jgi:hypothetical protein